MGRTSSFGSVSVGRGISIEKEFAQALQDLIEDKIKDSKELDIKYRSAYRSTLNSMGRPRSLLSFPSFAYLAQEMSIPIRDVFERMGVKLVWPNERAEKLDKQLRLVDRRTKAKLAMMVSSISPEFWQPDKQTCQLLMGSPTKRLLNTIRYAYLDPKISQTAVVDSWGIPSVSKAWQDRKQTSTIPIKDILKAGRIMGISPAWLLMWVDGSTTVLADSPDSEYIIAGYLFMREQDQAILDSIIDTLLRERES